MNGTKILVTTFTVAISYILVKILFLPTTLLLYLGRFFDVHDRLRKPLLFSDKKADEIRDRMAESITEGTESILKHEDYDALPSRHKFRQEGLKSVERVEQELSAGEFIISLTFAIIGVVVSIATLMPKLRYQISPTFAGSPIDLLTVISASSTAVGLLILILVSLRTAVVDYLAYGIDDFSAGSVAELLSKMAWNQMIAKKPAKMLQMYYVLWLADFLGEEPFSAILSVISDAMNPTLSKWDVMEKNLPAIMDSVFQSVSEEQPSSPSREQG